MPGAIPSPSSGSSPAQPPKPHDGGGKPKMSEKVGEDEFNKESSLTGSSEPSGGGGDKSESGSKKTADKAKDLAASASETAKDVKDVAKAGPTGLETSAQEIEQGRQKAGTKGAAAAAGREAAGQAVATGVDVITAGATTESHGKIAKATSKLLKKENLKKIAIGVGALVLAPAIVIGIIIGVLIYAAQDPAKFVSSVLTNPKFIEFSTEAAKIVPQGLVGSEEFYRSIGYIENKPGTAIAQTSTTPPKPGSLEEKISKIDIKQAQYQTNSGLSCPYKFTFKEMVNPDTGETTNVVDKVYNSRGQEVKNSNAIVDYCLVYSMPLFNMMIRTSNAREVNGFSNTRLSYAEPKDSENIKGKDSQQINDFVYEKTYSRITSKEDQTPKINDPSVDEYITNVRKALEEGTDPYAVDSDFQFPPEFDTEDKKTVDTMCTFIKGYLTPKNLRGGIYSRINTGQRSGMKWNTISSTRHLGEMSNEELGPTFNAIENWTGSRAYYQNLYGTQNGEAINPEALGNTAYGAGYRQALALMFDTRDKCNTIDENGKGIFDRIFGDGNQAELNAINADYLALKALIIAESNGKFTTPDAFGLQQLMIGIIRMGGGSAVSGLESGQQNFNNQSQGFRGISNQYMMSIGGRFFTREEMQERNRVVENTRREIEQQSGIAYRLFDSSNIRSLANIIQYEAPRTPNELQNTNKKLVATISNPFKVIADLHGVFSYAIAGKINRAIAADNVGDLYMRLDTIGLPPKDFEGVNLIQNSNEIQEIQQNGTEEQKKVLGYFEKCSQGNYPTKSFFIKQYEVANDEVSNQAEVRLSAIRFVGQGENRAPFYPTVADEIEYTNPDGTPNDEEANNNPIKAEKKAFMACEIMLQAEPIILEPGGYSGAAIPLDVRQAVFGNVNVEELGKKYRLYLYANRMADMMVQLSNTEEDPSIYANASGKSGSGGTLGNVECPQNLGSPNPARHNYYQLPPNPEAYTSYAPPDRQYGAKELVCALYSVGKAYTSQFPESKLRIGDLNASGHESHNWGVAVDLDAAGSPVAADNTIAGYSTEATIALGKLFVDTGIIQNIWWCDAGDGSIEAIRAYAEQKGTPINIKCIKGHYNHFHVDINCKFAGPIDLPGFANPSKQPRKPCAESTVNQS